MARKRKSSGASRVTPKGTQGKAGSGTRNRRLDPQTLAELNMLAVEADDCVSSGDSADLCAIEAHVSCMIGIFTASPWSPGGVSTEHALAHAETLGGPSGAVIAAGIAAYGDRRYRKRAQRSLERFVDAGVAVPDWVHALGVVAPIRAVKVRDQWDEYCTVVVDYARPDGTAHSLRASLHPFGWGMAYDLVVASDTTSTQQSLGADQIMEPISQDLARELLERGLDELDDGLRQAHELALDFSGQDADLRSLFGQRVELLSAGDGTAGRSEQEDDELVETSISIVTEFLTAPCPMGERAEDIGDLVHAMLAFAVPCHDQNPLRWTPPRVTTFIEQFLPGCWEADELSASAHCFNPSREYLATLDSAFPRWLSLVADRLGSNVELRDANLAAASNALRELRRMATGSPLLPVSQIKLP